MSMSEKCFFCQLNLENSREKITQSESFFVVLDAMPVTPGHALIIPKNHVISFLDLLENQWAELKELTQETVDWLHAGELHRYYLTLLQENVSNPVALKFISQALADLSRFGTIQGYNLGLNDGKAAGMTINHLHFHLIPRYLGDMIDPTGGVRHVIPAKGNYHK